MPRFEIQPLEGRVFLSAALPSDAPSEPVVGPVAPLQVTVADAENPPSLIPGANTPSQSLSQSVRQTLVNRLNAGTLKTTLTPLVSSAAAFDQALLDYTRANTTGRFFFGPADASDMADRLAFISASSLQNSTVANADNVLLHRFPQQSGAAYNVQVSDTIDFDNTSYSTNEEFLPYLNRFEYWVELGQAYLYTNNNDYVQEMVNELSSFALQAPMADPATWASTGGVSWDLLSASLRVGEWIWAYQMVLNSSAWSKEANTLFVSRLWEHGDFMNRAVPYEPESNRALFHAKSEMMLAQVFPEFLGAAAWEAAGRARMFAAMDAQLYNDGSHVEQSPNYTNLVIEDVLEAKWLDEINGDLATWPAAYNTKISNAIDAYRQLLSPDASQPAIGDTYRQVAVTTFTKAALIQDLITVKTSTVNDPAASGYAFTHTALKVADATQFAVGDQIHLQDRIEVMLVQGVNLGTNTLTVQRAYGTEARNWVNGQTIYNLGNKTVARARTRDVWLFGADVMEPFIDIPATPPLGERGKTKALTDSGNYIARSGNDKTANQVIFDAGPTGGLHGHYDLFNFELYGGGRPLISDPGAYIYGSSSDRNYVISTRAHNTISVATGGNHSAVEGLNNPAIVIDQYDVTANSWHITAHHHAYQKLAGRPVISRSMWYNLDGTMVIVDWAEGSVAQQYVQSFNIATEGNDANVVGVVGGSYFRTNHASGGNVKVTSVAQSGLTLTKNPKTFVTNTSAGNQAPYKDDAFRFTGVKTGTFVYFVTLISAYTGAGVPDTSATVLNGTVNPGDTINVQVTKDGVSQTINFVPPVLERPTANFGNANGSPNDIEYDSAGRLHMAFYDRNSQTLKYALRETSGLWSAIETIDSSPTAGEYLSLALDSNGMPGVAYYEAMNGDLKYAKYSTEGGWARTTVDSLQNVGMYPSLVFSRNNGPVISYYHFTKKDLRMAVSQTVGFAITTVDSGGDVGRWTSMALDPNRLDVSKFAIAYEDTSNGDTKFARQGGGTQIAISVAENMVAAGGYHSLAWLDSGVAGAQRYHASISYYDAADTSLKFALYNGNATWGTSRIAHTGNQGMYTSLFFDNAGRINIFYFDRTNLVGKRAKKMGASWTISTLGAGGRQIAVSKKADGAVAYSTQDENIPRLDVHYLPS